MTSTRFRKTILRIFLAFLSVTALVAIAILASGREFGDTEVKILTTSLTISAASICALSCAAFLEKRGSLGIGMTGVLLAAATAVLVIVAIWQSDLQQTYVKTTMSCAVLAIGFAHGCLLALADLERRFRWVQFVAAASIVVLAALIVLAVWGSFDDEPFWRFVAVVAVLVALETLAIPILTRLRKGDVRSLETLVLERLEDDVYRDRGGQTYRVTPVDD
jgi:hypothetical protein